VADTSAITSTERTTVEGDAERPGTAARELARILNNNTTDVNPTAAQIQAAQEAFDRMPTEEREAFINDVVMTTRHEQRLRQQVPDLHRTVISRHNTRVNEGPETLETAEQRWLAAGAAAKGWTVEQLDNFLNGREVLDAAGEVLFAAEINPGVNPDGSLRAEGLMPEWRVAGAEWSEQSEIYEAAIERGDQAAADAARAARSAAHARIRAGNASMGFQFVSTVEHEDGNNRVVPDTTDVNIWTWDDDERSVLSETHPEVQRLQGEFDRLMEMRLEHVNFTIEFEAREIAAARDYQAAFEELEAKRLDLLARAEQDGRSAEWIAEQGLDRPLFTVQDFHDAGRAAANEEAVAQLAEDSPTMHGLLMQSKDTHAPAINFYSMAEEAGAVSRNDLKRLVR